jgi:hypothetical protein
VVSVSVTVGLALGRLTRPAKGVPLRAFDHLGLRNG